MQSQYVFMIYNLIFYERYLHMGFETVRNDNENE